ncbi:MAG: hypothetical protein HYY16_18805 [Planctomycetes bacterium]|nr:hypothetical protein [Planctomycetota bacterium]
MMLDEFLRDLDRQTELYRQMLAATELPRMQELLREAGALDERLAPVRRRWSEVASTLDSDTARQAERSIGAARDVLARLVDRFVPPPSPQRVLETYGGVTVQPFESPVPASGTSERANRWTGERLHGG